MGLFSKAAIDKKYVIEKKELGSGNFAVVKKATIKPGVKASDIPEGMGTEVAIKIIDKAKVEDMNDITREIDVMGQLKHPNVIKLFEIFDEPKKMMLVMELVTGGELFDRIVSKGSYTEADAAGVILSLCDALNYMHAKKIVHRDLKPENILCALPQPPPPKPHRCGPVRTAQHPPPKPHRCGPVRTAQPPTPWPTECGSKSAGPWAHGAWAHSACSPSRLRPLAPQLLHAR